MNSLGNTIYSVYYVCHMTEFDSEFQMNISQIPVIVNKYSTNIDKDIIIINLPILLSFLFLQILKTEKCRKLTLGRDIDWGRGGGGGGGGVVGMQ